MGRRVIICITTLLQIVLLPSNAQQSGGIFYHLTSANGLSSDRTQAVIQDHEGFYWIATQDGLNRFDGSSCKIYRNNRNDSTSISHNNCIFLLEDDLGDIWVGTQVGLNRYKKREDKFERFYLSNPGIPFQETNSIRGLAKDENGNIWIASAGLWQFNIYSKKWSKFINDPNDATSIPPGSIFFLQYDHVNKGLWMSGRSGILFFDIAKRRFYSSNFNPQNLLILKTEINGDFFTIGDNGTIWFQNSSKYELCNYNLKDNAIRAIHIKPIGNSGFFSAGKKIWMTRWAKGPLIYDPQTNTIDSDFLSYYHPQSASSVIVSNIYIDNAGIYWISTDKGVNIFNPHAQNVKYYLLSQDISRVLFSITCIAEESTNILWVGTSQGLYKYQIAEKKYKRISEVHVNDDFVRCLFIQDDSVLWIGGHHELLRFDVKRNKVLEKNISITGAQSILRDSENNIWVATWESGLFEFSKSGAELQHYQKGVETDKTPASNKLVCASFSPKQSCLWLGYNGGNGFSCFYPGRQQFRHFKISRQSPSYVGSNTINCIMQDDKENLWIGTHGGGLVYFDQQKNNFTIYTQSDGLKGDYVHAILKDDSSRLWITTSNGLCIMESSTGSIINPAIDLSLASNDFVPNGIKLKNGSFLFFAGNKIAEINPISARSPYPSKILLNGFKIFDKEIPLTTVNFKAETIHLSYKQNFFSIQYSLIKPDPNSPVQYAYKLEGFDKDWNYGRERKIAYYTNVPSGHYVFYIKATDENGRWKYFSQSLAIIIKPPFWQRWWFIFMVTILIVAAIYVAYYYRLNQVKKFYSLRNKISQDLHDEVASALSGIKLYSELAKQQLKQEKNSNAQESLDIISTNATEMKEDMSDIIWAINPRNDSLGKLLQKLKSHATELANGAAINFEMKVDENLPEEKLNMEQRRNIYLICKEAIHNAVKYSKGNKIKMKVFKEDHTMQILIHDNGSGFDSNSFFPGNGLINIKARAKEIGAEVLINSKKENGTTIAMKMKL